MSQTNGGNTGEGNPQKKMADPDISNHHVLAEGHNQVRQKHRNHHNCRTQGKENLGLL